MGFFSKAFKLFTGITLLKKVVGWLTPSIDTPDEQGIKVEQSGTDKDIPIIYGFVKQAPCIKVLKVTTDKAGGAQNEYLHYICVFSVGEIEEIGELFFNDIPESEIIATKPDSFYIERFNGSSAQNHCATLTAEFSEWTSSAKLKGVAYAYVRLKQNQNLDWWQGEPTISADMKGIKVIDPRNGQRTYSNNPALCAYDYLTNASYGKGLALSKLKTASFIAAADFIEQNARSHTENNTVKKLNYRLTNGVTELFFQNVTTTEVISENLFTCNISLPSSNTIKKNVEILLGGMRAILPETDGKYRIAIEKDGAPVFAFTQDNLVGAIQCKGGSQNERYNQVIIKFRNVLTGKDDEAVFPDDDTLHQTWKTQDNGKLLLGEFDFNTINTAAEALQMGHVIAHRSRRLISAVFVGTPETLIVEAGDVVTLDSTILGWNAKPFRIEVASIDLEVGVVSFQAVEHQNLIYPWAINSVNQEYADTSLASPFRIDPPVNLQYHTVIMGAIQGYFSWDDVQNTAIRNWAIELIDANGVTALSTVSFEPRLELTTIPIGTYTANIYAQNSIYRSDVATKAVNITIAPTIVGADITDYSDNRIKNSLAVADAKAYTDNQIGSGNVTISEQAILNATNWITLPFSGADATNYNDKRVANGQLSLDINGYLSYLDGNNNPVSLGGTTIAGLGYSGALNATANQTDSAANLIASGYADAAESNAVAIASGDASRWKTTYSVSSSVTKALREQTGLSLGSGGFSGGTARVLKVSGVVLGTGTNTGATSLFTYLSGVWTHIIVDRSGTSSNHIDFHLDNGIPSIRTWHGSLYTVNVTIEDISHSGKLDWESVAGTNVPANNATANQTDSAANLIASDYANLAETNAKDYADGKFIDSVTHGTDLADLQSQIDGNITTWFLGGVPTLANAPVNTWTTTELKNQHLGDIYYDEVTGFAYRFKLVSSTYSWQKLDDSDITKALSDASKAQDTADSKRRVFFATPTTPYDKGDLWDTGSGFNRCTFPRIISESYVAADWKISSDITNYNAIDLAAQTKADLAETQAKAYADGIVTAEESRAIADATDKANIAEANAVAASDALGSANTAKTQAIAAAAVAAQAKADLAETQAKAYADGIVTAEESRAIADATAKANIAEASAVAASDALGSANTAKTQAIAAAAVAAQTKADLAETQAKAYADGIVTAEESRAIADATTKANIAESNAIGTAATDATNKVGSIVVGGTNIIVGTLDANCNINVFYNTVDTYKGFLITKGIAAAAYNDIYYVNDIDVSASTVYTLSFFAKASSNVDLKSYFYSPNTTLTALSSTGHSTTNSDGYCATSITTEWVRYWVTWTQSITTLPKRVIVARIVAANIEVQVCGVKFEVGNKATDWSPAPEDIDAAYIGLGNVVDGADITSENTAAGFTGQKSLATKDFVDLNSTDVTNKSLATLDSSANSKLAGIANNATVGATIGQDLGGGFNVSNIQDFFTAKVIGASLIDVTDLFAQSIVAEDLTIRSVSGSDFNVAIDANSNSPISIVDAATKKNVFSVTKVGGEAKALINGTPQNGFISGVQQINTDVLKAINQNYQGAGGSASLTDFSAYSGVVYSLSSIPANSTTSISFSASSTTSFLDGGGTSIPKWRVRIYRESVLIYNKLWDGGFNSVLEWEYITIEDSFIDTTAPKANAKYKISITRESGSLPHLACKNFSVKTLAFTPSKPVFTTLYENAGGLGVGNITLTEPYTNYDFLVVTGSDDGDDFIETVMYPVQAIEDDIANSDYGDFMLWSGYGSNYWRVRPNAARTYLTKVSENSIIHKIQGMNIGGS